MMMMSTRSRSSSGCWALLAWIWGTRVFCFTIYMIPWFGGGRTEAEGMALVLFLFFLKSRIGFFLVAGLTGEVVRGFGAYWKLVDT